MRAPFAMRPSRSRLVDVARNPRAHRRRRLCKFRRLECEEERKRREEEFLARYRGK